MFFLLAFHSGQHWIGKHIANTCGRVQAPSSNQYAKNVVTHTHNAYRKLSSPEHRAKECIDMLSSTVSALARWK
jgi:hypothetical protein